MSYIVCQAFKHQGGFLQPGAILEDIHGVRQWRMLLARRVIREIPETAAGKEELKLYFLNRHGMKVLESVEPSPVSTPEVKATTAEATAQVVTAAPKATTTVAKPAGAVKTPAKAVTTKPTGTK